MRLNPVHITVLVLGLATVATLVVSAALIRVPTTNGAPSEQVVRSLSTRLFDAMSSGPGHGEGSELDSLLASDFESHTDEAGFNLDRRAFGAYVTGTHATFPGIRFQAIEVSVDGNAAIVRFRIIGLSGKIGGLPAMPVPATEERVAFLRVGRQRIAEAWGLFEFVVERQRFEMGTANPSRGALVGIARRTYASGASDPLGVVPGTLVILPESGAILARVDGEARLAHAGTAADDATSPGIEIEIRPGDALIVSALSWYRVRNAGTEPVTTLEVALLPATAATWSETGVPALLGSIMVEWPVSRAQGVTVLPLIGGRADHLPGGDVRIGVGEVNLPHGTGLTWPSNPGAMLFAVETGGASITVDGSTRTLMKSGSDDVEPFEVGTVYLRAGGAIMTTAGPEVSPAPASDDSDRVTVRNDGATTLVLLLVTIIPEVE